MNTAKVQGDVLRSVRLQRGMTLRQVHNEAHIAIGYLSEVENGQKELSSVIRTNLCEALGIKESELLWTIATRLNAIGK